ncbi:MAG: hypothetical protein COV48_09950, partial [Elusimicrobia bacterium CG11_big_fil_rev_8_21_14_0_20_64_6]
MILLLAGAARAGAAEPRVEMDLRLETLGIVKMLTDGPPLKGFRAPNIEYVRRARKSFARFKNHRAVKLTAALPADFNHLLRTDALLRRGPLPALAPRLFMPDFLIAQAGGRERFDAWIAALAEFARDAQVEKFVSSNAATLDPALAEFREDVARRRYMAKLERYTGIAFEGTYAVHPSVFYLTGSQVNTVVRLGKGGHAIQSVVGADVLSGGRIDFHPE